MKKIIVVRHCTTAWNRIGRIQGRTNNDLDEGGKEEAKILAQKLEPLNIGKIITSDLLRAQRTAEIIAAKLGLSVIIEDPRLCECSFGDIEGMTKDEAAAQFGKKALMKDCEDYDLSFCGGENRRSVLDRHLNVLREAALHPEDTILFVGHGRGLNTLLGGLGLPMGLVRGEYRIIEL